VSADAVVDPLAVEKWIRVPLVGSVAWFKACAPVQAFEPRLTAELFAR
jgi:hypothetical protein